MADEESKLFSLKEAERLRVQLEPILIEAMEVRRKMAGFDEQLVALAERIQRSGGLQVPYERPPRRASSAIACRNRWKPRSSKFRKPAAW